MCKRKDNVTKERMIFSYIKGALFLEWKTDSGKVNFYTFLGAIIFALLTIIPDKIIDFANMIYSMAKLNTTYESKTNYLPLLIAVIAGMLCFVLMGFIFEKRESLKEAVKDNEDV
jgi:hypothetical protein